MTIPQHGGGQVRPTDEPIAAIGTKGAIRVMEATLREQPGSNGVLTNSDDRFLVQ
jgi:hypothetical protein